MESLEAQIDRLIHDAEHAEAGRDFAEMMARQQPHNPHHAEAARRLAEKARELRNEAMNLQRSLTART